MYANPGCAVATLGCVVKRLRRKLRRWPRRSMENPVGVWGSGWIYANPGYPVATPGCVVQRLRRKTARRFRGFGVSPGETFGRRFRRGQRPAPSQPGVATAHPGNTIHPKTPFPNPEGVLHPRRGDGWRTGFRRSRVGRRWPRRFVKPRWGLGMLVDVRQPRVRCRDPGLCCATPSAYIWPNPTHTVHRLSIRTSCTTAETLLETSPDDGVPPEWRGNA